MAVAVTALLLSLLAMLVAEARASAPLPVSEKERALAVRGCRGCALASEAGDAFLRKHLERECQSGAPVTTVGVKRGEYHRPDSSSECAT